MDTLINEDPSFFRIGDEITVGITAINIIGESDYIIGSNSSVIVRGPPQGPLPPIEIGLNTTLLDREIKWIPHDPYKTGNDDIISYEIYYVRYENEVE